MNTLCYWNSGMFKNGQYSYVSIERRENKNSKLDRQKKIF